MQAVATESASCKQIPGLERALGRLHTLQDCIRQRKCLFRKEDIEDIAIIKDALLTLAGEGRRLRDLYEVTSITATTRRHQNHLSTAALEREMSECTAQAHAAQRQDFVNLTEARSISKDLAERSRQESHVLREENQALLKELQIVRPQLYETQRRCAEVVHQIQREEKQLELTRKKINACKNAIAAMEEATERSNFDFLEVRFRAQREREKLQSERKRITTKLLVQNRENALANLELERMLAQLKDLKESLRLTTDVTQEALDHEKKSHAAVSEGQKQLIQIQMENVFKKQANEAARNELTRMQKITAIEKDREKEWDQPIRVAQQAQSELAKKRMQLYWKSARTSKSLRGSRKEERDLEKELADLTCRLKISAGQTKLLKMESEEIEHATKKKLTKTTEKKIALQRHFEEVKVKIKNNSIRRQAVEKEEKLAIEFAEQDDIAKELQRQTDEMDYNIKELEASIATMQEEMQELLSQQDTYVYQEKYNALLTKGNDLTGFFEDFQQQVDLQLEKTKYFEAFKMKMAKSLTDMRSKVEEVIYGTEGRSESTDPDETKILRGKSSAVESERRSLRRTLQRMMERAKMLGKACRHSMQPQEQSAGDVAQVDDGLATPRGGADGEIILSAGYLQQEKSPSPWIRESSYVQISLQHVHKRSRTEPKGLRYFDEIEKEIARLLDEMKTQLDDLASFEVGSERRADTTRFEIKNLHNSNADRRRDVSLVGKQVLSQIEAHCGEKKELEKKIVTTMTKIDTLVRENEKLSFSGQRLLEEQKELRRNLGWNLQITEQLQGVARALDLTWHQDIAQRIGDIPSARLVIANLQTLSSEVEARMRKTNATREKVEAELERFESLSMSPRPCQPAKSRFTRPPRPRPVPQRSLRVDPGERRVRMTARTSSSQKHIELMKVLSASSHSYTLHDRCSVGGASRTVRTPARSAMSSLQSRQGPETPLSRADPRAKKVRIKSDVAVIQRIELPRIPARCRSTPSIGVRNPPWRSGRSSLVGDSAAKSESLPLVPRKWSRITDSSNSTSLRRSSLSSFAISSACSHADSGLLLIDEMDELLSSSPIDSSDGRSSVLSLSLDVSAGQLDGGEMSTQELERILSRVSTHASREQQPDEDDERPPTDSGFDKVLSDFLQKHITLPREDNSSSDLDDDFNYRRHAQESDDDDDDEDVDISHVSDSLSEWNDNA